MNKVYFTFSTEHLHKKTFPPGGQTREVKSVIFQIVITYIFPHMSLQYKLVPAYSDNRDMAYLGWSIDQDQPSIRHQPWLGNHWSLLFSWNLSASNFQMENPWKQGWLWSKPLQGVMITSATSVPVFLYVSRVTYIILSFNMCSTCDVLKVLTIAQVCYFKSK